MTSYRRMFTDGGGIFLALILGTVLWGLLIWWLF